mmetsp:Transcript_72688/g.205541  ORF Transcript_72688/g.205541 Transcript_72688/m.205541 type:complete len:206 (+) Transcript_72688:309-926(+)
MRSQAKVRSLARSSSLTAAAASCCKRRDGSGTQPRSRPSSAKEALIVEAASPSAARRPVPPPPGAAAAPSVAKPCGTSSSMRGSPRRASASCRASRLLATAPSRASSRSTLSVSSSCALRWPATWRSSASSLCLVATLSSRSAHSRRKSSAEREASSSASQWRRGAPGSAERPTPARCIGSSVLSLSAASWSSRRHLSWRCLARR